MANISEDLLIDIVTAKKVDAENYRNHLDQQNTYLEDRYNGELYGTEVPGRSRFVSNDVKDAVEDAHTSLTRVFLGANEIVKFTAANPEDKVQLEEAENKTKFVDWLIRKQPDSYATQSSALNEILKLKYGAVKYFYEQEETTEDHEWENLQPEEVEAQLDAIVANRNNKEVEMIEHEENEDGTFNILIRAKVKRQEIKIIGVPSGSFLISQGATSKDDAELVGDEYYKTRGELLAEGHSRELVDSLPAASINGVSARIINTDISGNIAETDFGEWASQSVLISDLYVKIDYNGDGIAERRNIQMCNDIILVNEPFNHVPYSVCSALIEPHSVIGQGWGEQVLDIAEVNTAITRGTLDNVYAVNNTKKVVRVGKNGVNVNEAASNAIGGLIQVQGERPLTDIIMPVTTEFIGDKALLIKQHMDQMKSNRVGNQLTSQGLDGDKLAKETATRFTGIEKADAARIEKVARNIADVLGKALKSNPTNWKYDNNVDTEIGLGAGDDDKIVGNMSGAWQIHSQLKAEQSPLTDDKKGYNILNKLYKAMGVKDTSLLINDPEEPAEQLRAQNEQLNAMVLQLQEATQMQQQQIQQLQALSDVEAIKAQAKLLEVQNRSDNQTADREEKARQFNVKTAQDDKHHTEDTAVDLTKIEVTNDTDVQGSLV
jgi:hypothetical protein